MLEAEIVDRDYSYSTSTPSMKKAIKFAIFYKLRCANGFWGEWAFNGNDSGNIEKEMYKTYTK